MAQLTAPTAKLQVNEWNHVSFTLDVEKKRVELWVNKMNIASTAVDASLLPVFTDSANLLLGSDGTSSFHGLMDDVVIYERTVTDSELNSIMNNRNPELYLKSQLESYITFDRFRTNLDSEGIQVDANVVVQGENVNDFTNKSVRIQSSNMEPISKSNDGMSTNNMSVGCWLKPQTVDTEDVEIVSKAGAFSLGVKQGGEVSFSLGDVDPSNNRFLIEKEFRDLQTANTGSLRVPETAAARAQVTLSSGSYFANEFTVSMWFKVDEYTSTRTLMSGMGFSDDNKALCVEDGILYMYDASNTVIAQVDCILTDTWYHLVFTDACIVLNYRKYEYLRTPIWSSNPVLKLGNNFGNNKNFLGHIDEFVFYQKRIDFLSMFDLFSGRYPKGYESMVIVKYEFDDADTPGKDSSPSKQDLTLSTATRESIPAFEFRTVRVPYKGKEGILRTHYDFVNEVRDTSGNDNDPLSNTSLTFVNSFNNVSFRAAEFDGTTSKIDCKPETLADLDDGFTATTWVQLPNVLTPNTRYPIFAQEGVMMAWLQTDASLNLSSKVYISPKTDFMIKDAVWNDSSVDVTMSIKSVVAERGYYAALLLKPLDLSIPADVQALDEALIYMGTAPQSKLTIEYNFSFTEVRGIDGTMYPLSAVDNAYLYMRVKGDVYDLSSAKYPMVYDNLISMFDSTARTFEYIDSGPVHNFEALTNTNNSVTYLTDSVFNESVTVAEYTGKTSHNVTFTPTNDFVVDIVFKQTGGLTVRHSALQLVNSAGNAILYVADSDYWRFFYFPNSGPHAATNLYSEGETSGMYPAFEEWGRHTYVFRKETGHIEFYYNGVKGNFVTENAVVTSIESNVVKIDGFNPFDVENTLKIGYGAQGDQTEGTRIASVHVIVDDAAFPEFATFSEVREKTHSPTYSLAFASGTVANSFPTESGTVDVVDMVEETSLADELVTVKQLAYNPVDETQVVYWEVAPKENAITDVYAVLLHPDLAITDNELHQFVLNNSTNGAVQRYNTSVAAGTTYTQFSEFGNALTNMDGTTAPVDGDTKYLSKVIVFDSTYVSSEGTPVYTPIPGMMVTGFTNEPEIHQLTPSEQAASGVLFSSGGTLQLDNIPDSIENIVIRSSGFYSVGNHEVQHARGPAHYLFDGRYTRDGPSNGHHYDWHCNGQTDPWFVLDFGEERDVNILRLWRTGALDGFKIKMSNDSSLTRTDVTSWDYDFLVDDFKAWVFVYNGESTPLSDKTAMKNHHSTVVESTSTMYSATSGYHELEITVPRGRYMLFMGDGYHAYGLIQMHILQETVPVKCDLVGKYTGTDSHTLSFTPPYDYLVDLTVNADSAQKVLDMKFGTETISLNAADPWTLSGSFGEITIPIAQTSSYVLASNKATLYYDINGPNGYIIDSNNNVGTLVNLAAKHKNKYEAVLAYSNTGADNMNRLEPDPTFGHYLDPRRNYTIAYPHTSTQMGDQFFVFHFDPANNVANNMLIGDSMHPANVHINYSQTSGGTTSMYIGDAPTHSSASDIEMQKGMVILHIRVIDASTLSWRVYNKLDSDGSVQEFNKEGAITSDGADETTITLFGYPADSGSWWKQHSYEFIYFDGDALTDVERDDMYNLLINKYTAGAKAITSMIHDTPPTNTMNRFTLVARAATDSIDVYHEGLPATVTKVSGTTTVTDNSFTLGSDPTAQEVTLVIGGDENGELMVESCEVVQSAQMISTFADPSYVAEKQWALSYSQPIALNNVTPADTVLGWGKFDNYLKSDGTKLETGIGVELWKDYFSVPIENVWGTSTWMIIKTIDGKYYGVGFNQYGQMGMPYQDMASMTDAANVAESYYFKVPVELPHFATYDIKKMQVRQKSTIFLTTDGKLYGMGGAGEHSHFGTGENTTALYTITQLATDKVITDFSQSGNHTLILTTDNKLYTTGENRRCAIGDGTTTDRSTFVNVASAITNTEIVKSVYTTDHMQSGFFTESHKVFVCGWEYQNCYHMGNADTNIASFTETGFSDGRKIKQFFMTPIRTWMVDENNDIYVGGAHYENTNGWPSGVFGPSGHTNGPTLIDSSINDGSDVIDILQQSTTGIVVVREAGVYSFGNNTDGRLGNGDAVTTTTSTRAYKIADQHPVIAFITTGLGPHLLIGYRTMATIAPTLTDMDKITDINTIGMGRGVTHDILMGPAHVSDESTSNTSNSGRITSGEIFDFFKKVNDNVDGGPMTGNLSNGDKVYFTGHVSAGAQLFEPYNTTGGNGLISQGRYTGQDLFGYTMPNVGHKYSGAVMYELGSSSRPKQMIMSGFKYRVSHVWGSGFRGDIYVFYRKKDSGYDNFKFHEKVERAAALGNRATTEDLMFANPTPEANAFLLVFVANAGGWQELLRLQLFMNEPPPVIEYPKLPPYLFMDKFTTESDSVNLAGKVYSEHANISKVYGTTFDLDSFVSDDVTDSELISLLESSDIPANAKFVVGPVDQYVPTPIHKTLTHTVSNRGESIPIVADMMISGYMIAVDEDGRINRQFRLTGRKNMLVLGNTQEEILPEITFVKETGQVNTWEEMASRFTITSHITMKNADDGIYFHNHPIFMQGNWTVIYWAYTGANAEASGMITEHPTAPATVGWPLGKSIDEPYKYNTVELSKYDSQNGNNQSWEWFGVYSGDGTYKSDGWSGSYSGSPVRYTSWVQVGMVHDAIAKTMTAFHFRSATNYTTYTLSDVAFTATEGYLRLWRKYIHSNGTFQVDGIRILNNEVLTPEQISQDTRTTSQFATVL